MKLDAERLDEIESAANDRDAGNNSVTVLCFEINEARALVARAREADRLEVENDQLVEQRADLRSKVERSAGNAAHWQREKQTILDREKSFSDRATAAEAETTRLRAVVKKLRTGLELIVGKDRTMEQILWRDFTDDKHVTVTVNLGRYRQVATILAETAPDVPADHDGRAG